MGSKTDSIGQLERALPPLLLDQVPDPWSIGIYVGESPFSFLPAPGIGNPVLCRNHVTDVLASFLADPFVIRRNGRWYMFFEVLNWENGRGQIGLAVSEDFLHWTYQQIVLNEPFHLSYPYVFQWNGAFYMVPETHEATSVRLYRAASFPTDWRYVRSLVEGPCVDSSIFYFEERWWLFTCRGPSTHDNLHLYLAEDLMSPWTEHPTSPIISGNSTIARPAGRVVVRGSQVIRYAQDCYPRYGTGIRAFEVLELTPDRYVEIENAASPVLRASGAGWNGRGMHHIDPQPKGDGWVACVDGHFLPEGWA